MTSGQIKGNRLTTRWLIKLNKGMKKYFIGVDVSKRTLDCVLFDEEMSKMRSCNHLKTSNDSDGCDEMLKWLRNLNVTKKDILVCMEYTGRYSYSFAENLASRGISFSMVPAMKIKGAFSGARGKNDKMDAIRISQYASRYRDVLKPTTLKDKEIIKLRDLMNDRKMLVKDIATRKAIIKEYGNNTSDGRFKRAVACKALLESQLKEIEIEIIELIDSDESMAENFRLLKSIPGISLVNAVNLIIFTDNFKGFSDARKFASYCGIAPFEYSSGTSINKGTHVSKMANKMLKADLSMAAKASVWCDTELKTYYERKRAEGKSFGCVLNAVKFKLICRAFSVIKRGTPYVNTKKYAV